MRQWLVTAFLLMAATIYVFANDQPKSNGRTTDRPVPKAAPVRSKVDSDRDSSRSASARVSSLLEAATKHITDLLLSAYQRRDAKAFAAAFTVDGEYIDSKNVVFHGRKAIADEFATFFRESPESSMKIEVNSIRAIARNLITVDCTTHFKLSDAAPSVSAPCRLVCSREVDVWQIASLQEWDGEDEDQSHHTQVRQLEWMVGDWISEGRNSHFHFTCRWDDSGNYLLRNFTIEAAGARPLSGTQRIGYDPLTQRLKMWVFDSAGGFSEGYFNRDGEKWILKTSGVTSDGHLASATNTLTFVDEHRMASETTEHFINGHRIAETENLTIVRKPSRGVEITDQNQQPKN